MLLWMAKDGDGLHFEKLRLKLLYPSLRKNSKCTMDDSSCKKLIGVLVLNFKATCSAHVKVREKDFYIVLAHNSESAVTELL